MKKTFGYVSEYVVDNNILSVRNPFKLEIRSFVMNFNSGGFSLRLLYRVVDTGMGLADLWWIADMHCRKVESTKWLKHKLRAIIGGQ